MASVAHCLSTTSDDSAVLMPFIAYQLIPLDKHPGVCPIGIGDVPLQIIAKAILFSVGDDVVSAAGPLQTCAGYTAGSELPFMPCGLCFIRTVDCKAELLVDASNAFNSISCKAALENM